MDDPELFAGYPTKGSGVGALQGTEGKVLLLGALGLDAQVSSNEQELRGEYRGRNEFDPPGGPYDWFLAYGPEPEVFAQYAGLLADRLGRRGREPAPRVWCSWYSLFRDINEDTIRGVLPGLPGLPFDVFQVDDGWQRGLGDWEANERFPDGMEALAGRIRAAGYIPGLWSAPFVVQPSSLVYQEHPEWIIRDSNGLPVQAGNNWGGPYYALDTTHPNVQAWLEALIQTQKRWGYEYLKIDFLFGAALPGKRYQDLPQEAAYRQGLEIVRRAAGEAYVLACGAPIFASVGLADGLRVGPDVAPYWDDPERTIKRHDPTGPSVLNAITTSHSRLWLKDLLNIDPDVAFFRTHFNQLTPAEKALLRDLALIAGFKGTSDLPAWLDQDERQALKAFLEAAPRIERMDRYRFLLDGNEVDFSFVEARWQG
jgi:alpha-galactosidase